MSGKQCDGHRHAAGTGEPSSHAVWARYRIPPNPVAISATTPARGARQAPSPAALFAFSPRRRLIGECLAAALDASYRVSVVAVTTSVAQAAGRYFSTLANARRGVMVLDPALDGAEALAMQCRRARPRVSVIAVRVDEPLESLRTLFEAGLVGLVPADGSLADAAEIVHACAHGMGMLPQAFLDEIQRRNGSYSGASDSVLTPREQQVILLLERGLHNCAISDALGIRLATVKSHVHSILVKLDVESRSAAGARWRRLTAVR